MSATLLIFKLSVQSSYAENLEREADEENFDTLQWWLTESETWRVKTFAIDSDIHPHLIAKVVATDLAVENTKKHYGDVIAEQYSIEFDDPFDRNEVERKMSGLGGQAALEIASNKRFAIWNPDGRKYTSKTTPAKLDA